MRKKEEKKDAVYSAIAAIIALIMMLAVMNHYANGWDKYIGLHGPSFLSVFLTFLGGGVVIFALICVGVAIFHKPPNHTSPSATKGGDHGHCNLPPTARRQYLSSSPAMRNWPAARQ